MTDKLTVSNSNLSAVATALDETFEADDLLQNPRGFMRMYLDHHARHDFNLMHDFSFEEYRRQIAEPLHRRVGRRVAIAAPRGAAKSTVHTLLFPIMDILSGRERHQVIISGTLEQARNRLASIARELRSNVAIRDVFFGGRLPRMKINTRRIELGGCRIEAFSAGSEMRGIAHGEYRPTRIILDDVEQSNRATEAAHRRRLLGWYDEVVENLGDSYTHITMVGTILHSDSLLSVLLRRPGYRGELYRSIMEWDRRPDLWRAWRRLFTGGGCGDGEGAERAEEFLRVNRAEMLEGTRVLWPAKEPYEKLQERLLVAGRSAFFKEKQNSPIRDGSQLFDTGVWSRFRVRGERIEVVSRVGDLENGERITENGGGFAEENGRFAEENGESRTENGEEITENVGARRVAGPVALARPGVAFSQLRFFGYLDPALGKSVTRDGDFAAIVTVGQAPDNTLYVVNVWMEKASPMRQVEQVFALHQRYKYVKFGFESNEFQETMSRFFLDQQAELKRRRGLWHLPIAKVDNRHSKHSRIAMLEPHMLAGTIVFDEDLPQEFFVQADEYKGNRSQHDDGLDALAGCVEMIRDVERPVQQIRRIRGRTVRW